VIAVKANGLEWGAMLEDLLQRRPYNAVTDLVDAPVERGLAGKAAFIDPERALSYGELQARSCRFASALRDIGLRPEERLALLLYDTVDFPAAFWGGVRAGIVVLPLNTLLNAEQYAYILGDSRAAAIVVSASLAKMLVPILDRLPRLRTIILVDGTAADRAAFSGRDVYDFADLLARGSAEVFTAPTLSDEIAFWLLESARQEPAHVRRRMDLHRRQIFSRRRRLLSILRPHRRHVQGQRHVGVAVRGRSGTRLA
jgi:acyl-CoA synthetase (AMP-forming)/AMP-acid ligase II